MKSKQKVVVAVTGLNNIDSPGPGIPVIRALKESDLFDVYIIGLSYETLEPGIYMREWVDKVYQIPLPSAGAQVLFERLEYINSQENLDVIIPNFDAELHNFIKLQDDLKSKLNIASLLPSSEVFESRSKMNLNKFGEDNKVLVPKSFTIFSINEIAKIESELTYPIVIKGKYYDASIAASRDQAINYFHKISSKWGLPIIIQEYVSGTEVNVTALGDGKGKCIGAVPMRKLYITDKGKAWSGISLLDDELLNISKHVVRHSKWSGGCELEFMKTKDNKYYLMEMNPRFPAWVYLAKGCGQNHPEAMVSMALGKSVMEMKDYAVGKMFIRYSMDMIVGLEDFQKISTIGEL